MSRGAAFPGRLPRDPFRCRGEGTDHAGGLIGLAEKARIKAYWGPCLPAFNRHLWLFGERGADAILRGLRLEETLQSQGVQMLYPLEGFASVRSPAPWRRSRSALLEQMR